MGKVILHTDRIARYTWLGQNQKDWYKEAERSIIAVYGKERHHLVAKLLAATSMNTSLKSNITLFKKALKEIDEGKPIGKYLPNMIAQIERVRAGLELSGPKISSFARAMCGDRDAVVVDMWIARAFKLPSDSLSIGTYRRIEAWVREEALHMGLEPRQLQAMIWAGIRKSETGRENTSRYCEILRTSQPQLFEQLK